MLNLINYISILGSFLFLFSLLFLLQRYTLGFIPLFGKPLGRKIRNLSIGDVVFSLNSIFFLITFMDFIKPY